MPSFIIWSGSFIHAVYNYPTRSEAYKYAAYDGLGRLAASSGARVEQAGNDLSV